MFQTIRYRGYHIHVSILYGVEKIQAQTSEPGGRFELKTCRTYIGAQRAITKHVRANADGSANP
ncbi:hypothetical protein KEX41_28180 (plasmid) [Burkholderia thailandensis]|uniref:hypothetical protein n=1 Tax=Burkholderia thailandensis TaxID=57975 RepID=UPI00192D3498|nr:hypothetical protein [Burkholderia thailandensis]MBS2132068.1 hypothetical protein [Burkholderia thailandensis]QRA15182.1 hypothetical protein JMY07_30215 [Burkholderia thailandensis]